MSSAFHQNELQRRRRRALLVTMVISVLFSSQIRGQTTSTGALTGLVLDQSGAVLPGSVVVLTNQETRVTYSAASDGDGRFSFPLLPPGDYEAHPSTTDSVPHISSATASVTLTETAHLQLHLRLTTVI